MSSTCSLMVILINLEVSDDLKIDEFTGYSHKQKKDVTADFSGHNSEKK